MRGEGQIVVRHAGRTLSLAVLLTIHATVFAQTKQVQEISGVRAGQQESVPESRGDRESGLVAPGTAGSPEEKPALGNGFRVADTDTDPLSTLDPGSNPTLEPESLGGNYTVGVGDVLQINVWREPEVSVSGVTVRPDGKISLPLIKEVHVLGLTPSRLEEVLTQKFGRLINGPDVTVIVSEIHSLKVHVIGGVRNPGSIELLSPLTVLQALAEVGGLTEYAKKKRIYVLREEGGRQSRLPFDYMAVIRGNASERNFPVRPGDTVVVPE